MKIKVLPDLVINQIAAGEVVDRPVAVVRELVDNAIDAGATEVTIALENGGHSLISVSDNGCGMERDDALLSFERHATSKIREVNDLQSIHSFGFRGEALASIAAVSKVVVRTRTAEAAVATEVTIEGGKIRGVREVAGPVGTVMQIRSLFFNTPARKKFLRQPKTEEERVRQWVLNSSIAHPEVRYRLQLDGADSLTLPRQKTSLERAKSLIRGTSVEVRWRAESGGVEGVVAHPSLAQFDSAALLLFVNGRMVSDRILLRAVREGFSSTLKDHEYPRGFISIEIPPHEVDVNVHPQKAEVRFHSPSKVFQMVRDAVADAVVAFRSPVMASAPSSPMKEPSGSAVFAPRLIHGGASGGAVCDTALSYGSPDAPLPLAVPLIHRGSYREQATAAVDRAPTPSPTAGAELQEEPQFRFQDLTLVGQVLSCYLIGERGESLYLIDMHAAHERYNYNLIRRGFRERSVASQQLLIPQMVELTPEGCRRCTTESAVFQRFGFEIEPFGDSTVAVRAAPALLSSSAVSSVVKEVAALPLEATGEGCFEEVIDGIAARLACHASIRSGDGISLTEARTLLAALDSSEFSAACPHGRPVIVSFSIDQIERWFGRDR